MDDLVIPYVIQWHGEPEPDLTGIDDPVRVPFQFVSFDEPSALDRTTEVLHDAFAWAPENLEPVVRDLHRIGTEGTPRNNQAQSRQMDDVVRILRLTPSQRRELHEIAKDLFRK